MSHQYLRIKTKNIKRTINQGKKVFFSISISITSARYTKQIYKESKKKKLNTFPLSRNRWVTNIEELKQYQKNSKFR